MAESRRLSPIAIVAMGAKFPGRGSTGGFWRDIVEGIDASGEIPGTHWLPEDFFDPDPKAPDKTYSARGAFIPAFPFDPVAFGTPPSVIETTDTVQLLALCVAKQVLAEAQGAGPASVDPERTSVVLGVAAGTELIGDMASRLNRPVWIKAMLDEGLAQPDAEAIADRISGHYTEWRESTFPGLLGNVVAGRIANRLDLGGTNFTADAACASSLAAIRYAAQELWLGDSDMVLAGGADALNNIFMYMCFSKTPAMSPSGTCRPFSDDADGTLMGEGCGIVALRRLEDAERDGNPIYAVITGMGASSDGRGTSVYAPCPGGQARAIRRALSAAGVSPKTVELMEAHGTGTRAGDAAEVAGLKEVFDQPDDRTPPWCALGSIKSQIGHTKSAAGAAGLIKIAAALHHKVLPPTINIRIPNPKLGIEDSAFYLNTKARPWIRGDDHPRRASISSFGFGGSNFHMTLEEYSSPECRPFKYRTSPTELILVSANSEADLGKRLCKIADDCRHDDDLPHCAAASQVAFDVTECRRLALVIASREELTDLVARLHSRIQEGRPFEMKNAVYAMGPATVAADKTAFLFAGQGSQYLGMGADLAMTFDGARTPWDRAAADPELACVRLHDLAFPPPPFSDEEIRQQSAKLTRTENAQPAIGLVALGQLALLQALQLRPDCVAGHSFGEIMALHAAGALDAEAAIWLARARGEAMACAAGTAPGAMLAVFASRDLVEDYISGRSSNLVLANDNAPNQVILSGPVDAIEKVEQNLSDDGVRVRRLDVPTAFHSPLVAAAAPNLRTAIDEAGLRAPHLTVYANMTAEPYPEQESVVRDLLTQQLVAPVRFRETIERMYQDGVRTFIEVGPSSVLTGLTGSILSDRPHLAVSLDRRNVHGVTSLQHALARLATAGHAVNFDALWEEAPAPEPRPEPKPHAVMLNGANYGKPYPPQGGCVALPTVSNLPAPPQLRTAESQTLKTGAEESAQSVTIECDYEADMDNQTLQQSLEMHESLSRQHRHFVDTLSQAHMAFLRASENMCGSLNPGELDGKAEPSAIQSVGSAVPISQNPPELGIGFQANKEIYQSAAGNRDATTPSHVAELREADRSKQAEARHADEQQVTESVAHPTIVTTPADHAAFSAAAETVRAIVAEKTGYPADMLELGMDLEAELGIDSIKQVEILSALHERIPDMPEIEPARLAELRTLQLIAEAVAPTAGGQTKGETAPAPVAAVPQTQDGSDPGARVEQAPAEPAGDQSAAFSAAAETVRAIVAEKTGYPADMLELGMDLEAELGIDSIKQVEILSALHERIPDMPEIEPARLAELRTLQLIAEAVAPTAGGQAKGETAPAPVAAVPQTQDGSDPGARVEQAPAEPAGDQSAAFAKAAETVRAVVAEKTGYPADMLELGMDLEAELGIDSIKQVEILSALHERIPDMPEIEPARLAELRTLQLIAEAVAPTAGGQTKGETAPAPVAAVPQTQDGSDPGARVEQAPAGPAEDQSAAFAKAAETVRAVVAEKTGYPADMLELGMDLEAELGIDSIKQVEILSALHERIPDMPEIEPARLAELRTLQLIAEAVAPTAGLASALNQGDSQTETSRSDLSIPAFLDKAGKQGLFRQIVGVEVIQSGAETAVLYQRRRIEITCEAQTLAAALADALKVAGHDARVVDHPSDEADIIVVTSGLAEGCEAIDISRSALAAARRAAARLSQSGGNFVLLQDTGGDFGRTNCDFDDGARGGLTGLAKTAAHEWPAAQVRVIDVERQGEPAAETARRIASEILCDNAPLEVGLKLDGRRLTSSVETASYGDRALSLPDGANIVVSGGGRGITAQVVRRLSALGHMRFLLLGRSEVLDWPTDIDPGIDELQLRSVLADKAQQEGRATSLKAISSEAARLLAAREIMQTVSDVRSAGCEVDYVAVDVSNASAVAAAVKRFRDRHGPITGMIHGAGQLADKLIKDKTDEQLQRVFESKVNGFRSLWSAVQGDDLSFVALFSSIAGRFGSPGQADYAMANEVLNRFAWHLRRLRPQTRVMSINWGPWLGGMVNEGVRTQFEQRGIPLIPPEIGVDAFVAELFHGQLENPEVVFAGKPVSAVVGVDAPASVVGGKTATVKVSSQPEPSRPSVA